MEKNKEFLNFLYKCTNKDKGAWDIFVDIYSQLIYNYIIRALKIYNYSFHDDEIADIFDSVFLSLLDKNCKKIKNFRGQNERSFKAYLRKVTFNMTIDFLRKQKKFVSFEQIQNVISDNKNNEKLYKRDIEKIVFMLRDKLPERQKYLFKLIYEEERGLSEIADLMKLRINAVHQLKHRMTNNMIRFASKEHILAVR